MADGDGGEWSQPGGGAPRTLEFHSPGVLTLDANTAIVFDEQTSPEAFDDNDFNLHLVETDPLATTRDILGDLRPETPESTDDLGNVKVSGTPEPGREDRLNDSDGADRIEGRSGRDILDARRGGNDLILAGAGSDIATGGDGDDRLHAGPDDTPLDQAIALGNSPGGGGDKGDWLNGAAANDPIRILAA